MQCINTGLTAEQSSAILGAAPKAPAAEAQTDNAFAAAMANVGNPDVRPGAGAVIEQDDPKLITASWDRAFRVTGNA